MSSTLYLILAVVVMMLASYIPRVLPIMFIRKKIKSRFICSILYYMPYAVLSALTFPSIFYCTGNIITATIGTILALILSIFKVNLAIVAAICSAVVFGCGYLF